MATNTGKNFRQGEVKHRSQVFNPTAKVWVKRDTTTGRFMDVDSSGEKYKGIRREGKRVG